MLLNASEIDYIIESFKDNICPAQADSFVTC